MNNGRIIGPAERFNAPFVWLIRIIFHAIAWPGCLHTPVATVGGWMDFGDTHAVSPERRNPNNFAAPTTPLQVQPTVPCRCHC